ncbi:MAG: 4Fe-4S dicluster domain-containing protein [Desulfosarcinaceae bacterium]
MAARRFIKTNFDLCTGCGICTLVCSQRLLGGYNPHRALLKITHSHENLYHYPVVCNQCENAYCANVCPVGAIDRNPTTYAMEVDPAVCVGCNLCGRYCPIGVVGVDPDLKKSVKCDLCQGEPRCVAACPTGALELGIREPVGEANRAAEHEVDRKEVAHG